jgi:hypothetical protein
VAVSGRPLSSGTTNRDPALIPGPLWRRHPKDGALALCQSKSAARGINIEPQGSCNQHRATKQAEFQGGIKALTRENIALSELYGD